MLDLYTTYINSNPFQKYCQGSTPDPIQQVGFLSLLMRLIPCTSPKPITMGEEGISSQQKANRPGFLFVFLIFTISDFLFLNRLKNRKSASICLFQKVSIFLIVVRMITVSRQTSVEMSYLKTYFSALLFHYLVIHLLY